MQIIQCDQQYATEILFIFNDAILHSTALYDYEPRTPEMMDSWFAAKQKGNYPVIGLIDNNNQLLGFGTYGIFRERPANKYTVEHSLYVHPEHRGNGYGKILLQELIKAAINQDYHCLIAGIDSGNVISKKLHEQYGFTACGTLKEVGYKFDRWLNLDFYQLLLSTPSSPNEVL